MAEIHIYKMKTNPYIGHEAQLWGVEEVRLQGGKGDGMRLLNVYNGAGLRYIAPAGTVDLGFSVRFFER